MIVAGQFPHAGVERAVSHSALYDRLEDVVVIVVDRILDVRIESQQAIEQAGDVSPVCLRYRQTVRAHLEDVHRFEDVHAGHASAR